MLNALEIKSSVAQDGGSDFTASSSFSREKRGGHQILKSATVADERERERKREREREKVLLKCH